MRTYDLTGLEIAVIAFAGTDLGYVVYTIVISNFDQTVVSNHYPLLQVAAFVCIGTLVTPSINRSGVKLTHSLGVSHRLVQSKCLRFIEESSKSIKSKIDAYLSQLRNEIDRHVKNFETNYLDIVDGSSAPFEKSVEQIWRVVNLVAQAQKYIIDELKSTGLFRQDGSMIVSDSYEQLATLLNDFSRHIPNFSQICNIANIVPVDKDGKKILPTVAKYSQDMVASFDKIESIVNKILDETSDVGNKK